MTAGGDFYTRIAHPTEIIELLETMSQPGSASLVPEQDQAAQLPVVVATASGDALHLDIGCGVFLATQIMKLRRGEYLHQKVFRSSRPNCWPCARKIAKDCCLR